jgi:predicted ATP-dependent protease
VNEKIEGFFDTCRALGRSDGQGVIIPRANAEHLMLRDDVAEAAARGELQVYPVDTVDQAMEILTGMVSGAPGPEGESPEGTLNHRVEQQLIGFAVVAKRFGEMVEMEEPEPGTRRKSKKKKRR